MAQHRAFRRACRAAGVLDDRKGLGQVAERMGLKPPVIVEEVAERDAALVVFDCHQHAARGHLRLHRFGRERVFRELADDQTLEARRRQELFSLRIKRGEIEGDQVVRVAVLYLRFERAQGVERRVIHHRSAGLQDAEEGDDVMGRIRQIEADTNARPDAEFLEASGGAVGERLELGIGDALVHELERRQRAEALRRGLEHALHRRDLDRRVPTHSGWIGLEPRPSGHVAPPDFPVSSRPAFRRAGASLELRGLAEAVNPGAFRSFRCATPLPGCRIVRIAAGSRFRGEWDG